MKRYSFKKIDNKWYAWDKKLKASWGEGYDIKLHAQHYFNNNHPNPIEEYSRTSLQYYYDNKDSVLAKAKIYRDNNKEKLKKYRKGAKALAFQKRTNKYIQEKKLLKDIILKKNVGLTERICPHCNQSFWAKGKKKYCKRTHSRSHQIAKDLRKRLGKGSSSRIPPWQDKEILMAFLDSKPEGMQLDHIIPLNNEIVCGLHCIENFQFLTPEENSIKSNYFDGTCDNDSWREILKKKS